MSLDKNTFLYVICTPANVYFFTEYRLQYDLLNIPADQEHSIHLLQTIWQQQCWQWRPDVGQISAVILKSWKELLSL